MAGKFVLMKDQKSETIEQWSGSKGSLFSIWKKLSQSRNHILVAQIESEYAWTGGEKFETMTQILFQIALFAGHTQYFINILLDIIYKNEVKVKK